MDPLVEGKKLEVQRPTAMEDSRFDVWWKFMVESFDGTLSEEDRFMFQVEELHRNLPVPPAPADASVHQASVNAAKTVPIKKPIANGAVKKSRKASRRVPSSERDGLLDPAGLAEDEDEAMLETALDDQRKFRLSQRTRKSRRVESPDPELEQAGFPEELAEADKQPRTEASSDALSLAGGEEAHSTGAIPNEAVTRSKPRPRARGELPSATEVIEHSSFPDDGNAVLESWKEVRSNDISWKGIALTGGGSIATGQTEGVGS